MPSTSVAIANRPELAEDQSKPRRIERVTGKVRVAIEQMVWAGLPRTEAAKKAGISDHGLYKALRKPPVKAFYLREMDVLRTSERARNIHRAVEIREQNSNQMAAIQAIKLIEQLDDQETNTPRANALPGLQIVIVQGGHSAPTIDVTPGRSDDDQ